jgi:hypothetical protein
MHKTVTVDADGNYVIEWDPPIGTDFSPSAIDRKHENIKHLRKVQSSNFLGRTAMKMIDLFAHHKEEAA